MPLKPGSTENAQPAKPVMQDETSAPAASTDTPGSAFEHGADNPPAVQSRPDAPTGAAGTALTNSGGASNSKFGSMEGKLGFGAFPQVKLDKDMFAVGEEGEIENFDFMPMGSQSRWIYKNTEDEFFFSYDKVNATDGRPVQTILDDWKAQGAALKESREYQEVYGYIKNGEFADRMVVLSIPPASVPRLAGLRAELQAMRGLDLDAVVIRIEKGAKIKTKAGQTFYPWKFSYKCKKEDYTAPAAE